MEPLINPIMNQVECWSQNNEKGIQGWAKRHVLTRGVTVLVGVPLEIATIVQNIIAAPFYAVGASFELVTKSFRMCSSSEILRKIDEALPSPKQFIKTVLRVAAYIVGTFSTLFIGFISPSANFRLHCAVPFLELSTNFRENKIKAEYKRKLEEEQQKRAQEEAQAEEILAAVAAMLERAEIEAEREANNLLKNPEEVKPEETKVVTQQVEAQVTNGVAVIEKTTEEVQIPAVKQEQPTYLERFFGLKKLVPQQPQVIQKVPTAPQVATVA